HDRPRWRWRAEGPALSVNGDVQEALESWLQLDEDAEVGELGDLALPEVAGVVAPGDVALPGVVVHLLEAQGDALALLIDVEDDAGDAVALADDLAGVGHLTHPAHVADVQQAVDAFLDLDERAVAGEVAHRAGDDGRGNVGVGECGLSCRARARRTTKHFTPL